MRRFLAPGFLLCFVLSLNGFSQSTSATLGGTVQDSTGALLPGVAITATNTGTGIVTPMVSNETGIYQFASLPLGTYEVEAYLPGFRRRISKGFQLGSGQQARLNFELEIETLTASVDVIALADTALATSSNSVGTVWSGYKIFDLPLAGRNAMDLLGATAGVQSGPFVDSNIAGSRASQISNTRDGISVSDGRAELGSFSSLFASADLVEEVKVVIAPVDAQTSRGSVQVSLVTRSGTNEFHGSLFHVNHNSALDANNWFDNFNGVKKNYDNRNQFGGRLGGPILKRKTFFFFLFDGQRAVKRENATGRTLTVMARQGIFRYFPGVDNANAGNANPAAWTVDRSGNPVRPAGATGDLAAIDLFGNCTFNGSPTPNCREFRDPLRPAINTSAFMQETLRRMPLPNDFTGGDGLNTAFIRFPRRVEGLDVGAGTGTDVNRDQYNLRIDHQFNKNHRLSLIGTKEKTWAASAGAVQREWPGAFDGLAVKRPDLYIVTFTSFLSPTVVNEFRAGRRRTINSQYPPANRPDAVGAEALKVVPVANGVPFQVMPTNWTFLTYGGLGKWRGHVSPMHTFGDDIGWTHRTHAFKAGFEWRNASSSGFGDPAFTPVVTFGAGNNPVAGLTGAVYSGLTGNSITAATSLLTDLTGSIATVNQSFGIESITNTKLTGAPAMPTKYYQMQAREISTYFKDEWKLGPSLTVNLGIHWEYYGQPFEKNGLAARIVGNDESALTGVTCTSSPGTPGFTSVCSNLTRVAFVGNNSTNPGVNVNLKGNDLNNWGPTVGFSWNVPWFGRKTVLRSGYGISYQGALRSFSGVESAIGQVPGINLVGATNGGVTYMPSVYTSISTLVLPVPFPDGVPTNSPFVVPTTDRTLTISTYNRVSPYVQNWNLEIQREVATNTTVEVRYIGMKGTKLKGSLDLNQIDALSRNRPLFDAFNAVRAGGESALLDQMLMGTNLGGAGAVPVNGTTWTGAMAVRTNPMTQAQLANGNLGAFLSYLNTRSTPALGPSTGAILRLNGFPENYIAVNPQYAGVSMLSNLANSTYHALQVQFTRRLMHGFTNTTTWTWSKALGESDSDPGATFRDPANRSIEKTNLGFDRTHQITSNGIYQLPFGTGRLFLANAPSWVQHIVGKWQLGGILNFNTGAPLDITSGIQTITFYQTGGGAQPNIVGPLPKDMGKTTKVSNGVVYFPGFTQTQDPSVASISTLNGLRLAYSNKAIVDPNGNIVLVNPQPGEVGTLGYSAVKGPATVALDVNLIKRFAISEGRELQFRVDAINVLNRPNFGNPNTSINSNTFGQITSAGGARSFVVTTRINF